MELTPKVMKRLLRDLAKKGWTIEETRKGWMCKSPDGKKLVTIHKTASDYRAGKNILAELRQGGYEHGKR